jgi:hypothetical protein
VISSRVLVQHHTLVLLARHSVLFACVPMLGCVLLLLHHVAVLVQHPGVCRVFVFQKTLTARRIGYCACYGPERIMCRACYVSPQRYTCGEPILAHHVLFHCVTACFALLLAVSGACCFLSKWNCACLEVEHSALHACAMASAVPVHNDKVWSGRCLHG